MGTRVEGEMGGDIERVRDEREREREGGREGKS